ncbi:MAG: class I SAM-dependent methyltransferase [Sedimentisphaerales bacterium]|nr:class I SAM-dependent methyltransferase [Sedimentisphaerales bacterium]
MKNVKDSHTIAYFNDYVPEYPLSRFEPALKVINRYGNNESSFLDVGCGTGNVLDFIRDTTIVRDVYGMDVSSNCLAKTR